MMIRDLLAELNRSLETIDSTKELILRIAFLIALLLVIVVLVLSAVVFDLRKEIFELIQQERKMHDVYKQILDVLP